MQEIALLSEGAKVTFSTSYHDEFSPNNILDRYDKINGKNNTIWGNKLPLQNCDQTMGDERCLPANHCDILPQPNANIIHQPQMPQQ